MEDSTLDNEQRQFRNPRSLLLGPILAILILLPLAIYSGIMNRRGTNDDNNKTGPPIDQDGIWEDLTKGKVSFKEAFADSSRRTALFEKLSKQPIRVPLSKSKVPEESANSIPGDMGFNQGVYELPFAEWLLTDEVRRGLREAIQKGAATDKVVSEWEAFREKSGRFKRILSAGPLRELYIDKPKFASSITQGEVTGDELLGLAIMLKRHAAAMELLHDWRKQTLDLFQILPDEGASVVMDNLVIDYNARESKEDRAANKTGRVVRQRTSAGENVATGPIGLRSNHPVRIYDIDPTTLEADFYTTFAREPPLPGSIKFRDPPLGEKIAKGRKVLIRYESMPLATHEATMAQLREAEDRLHASITDLDPDLAPILQDLKTWSPEETLERTTQGAQ